MFVSIPLQIIITSRMTDTNCKCNVIQRELRRQDGANAEGAPARAARRGADRRGRARGAARGAGHLQPRRAARLRLWVLVPFRRLKEPDIRGIHSAYTNWLTFSLVSF